MLDRRVSEQIVHFRSIPGGLDSEVVLGDHGDHVEVPIRLDLLSVEKLAYHLGEDRADLIGAVGPPVAGEAVAWEGVFGLGQKETGHGRGKVTMRYRDRNASAAELRVSILTRPGQSWRDQDQRDVSQLAVEAPPCPKRPCSPNSSP